MRKSALANFGAWFVVALVVVLVAEVKDAAAANCTPTELSSCAAALITVGTPSRVCCVKLKEQQPCFCSYIKNPSFKAYVDSPIAKKIAAACGVAIPNC
ncbi:hypothetical protein ACJIZ3_003332 [Penstemon smallii]|uniref:Bifunctional inhibitor/plant lipid transfer protein/seed storage helical domain-containing protein n=1 Tax=Penstemon smallii TaxID=265156 RepID=A0ABD3U8Y4_9LAMI